MLDAADAKVARQADARAEKIVRQISRMAAKQGFKDVYVRGRAHRAPGYYAEPTGAVVLTFTALSKQGTPRDRTVNDLRKPFDLARIVGLLVEKHKYDDAREAARVRQQDLSDGFARQVVKLRARFPRMPLGIWLSSDAGGITLEVPRLTARRAGEVLAVLRDRFPVEAKVSE